MRSIERFLRFGFGFLAPVLAVAISAQLGVAAGTVYHESIEKLTSPAYEIKVLLKKNDYASARAYLDSPICPLDEESWLYWSARLIVEKQANGLARASARGKQSALASAGALQDLMLAEDYLKASIRFSDSPAKSALLERIRANSKSLGSQPAIALAGFKL